MVRIASKYCLIFLNLESQSSITALKVMNVNRLPVNNGPARGPSHG